MRAGFLIESFYLISILPEPTYKLEEQIGNLISQRTDEIFIETGYDIGAIVYEKSQSQETTVAC